MPWYELAENPSPPARRPNDLGRGKRVIHLYTNHFEVTIKKPNITLVHYDVDIKLPNNMAAILPKKKRMMIFENMKATYPKIFHGQVIGFDSEKNAYSTTPLFKEDKANPGKKFEVNLKEVVRAQKFVVTMKAVNHENLSTLMTALRGGNNVVIPQTIIQMLEVMIQHNLCVRHERVGRDKFFSTEGVFGNSFDIGGGKEALVGFFGSLRPVGWKDNTMLLNVDVVNAAFYKEQGVIDFIKELLDINDDSLLNRPLNPQQKRKVTNSLKRIKIRVTHTDIPRTYRVLKMGDLGADRQTFLHENKKYTVQQYFMQRYNVRLRYPQLNLVQVSPEDKKVYLPVECCKIAKGQKVQGKLSDRETSQFIRNTAKPPSKRLQHITDMVRKQKFDNDPNIKGLEFSISEKPMAVKGHILHPPNLLMNRQFPPDRGVWDIRDKVFYSAADLKCWAVLNYNSRYVQEEALKRFINTMKKMGKDRGMNISDPALVPNVRYPDPEKDLPNVKQKLPAVQLIMVVLPKDGDIYARVKKVGDREISVVTQCIKDMNVNKSSPPLVSNLLLKINAKIGGVNNVLGEHRLVVFSTPVMIMGADVNHPPAHDKATPSLAAVVASMDRHASSYAVEVRHQKHRTEMIQDLKEMTKNLLIAFYRRTKRKPERIVMFRDGVSESQFLEVLSFELRAMRSACTDLEAAYKPSMTFIVVQKRHHTRLFCSDDRDGVGKAGNVPPGTTVDTTITHPTLRDFYLCSHQGIIGTSRPTHYHVLWDDSDLSMEMLQNLTYAMCHLYFRCTRSVSIPAPAYYAHLVAFRAKLHIRDLCPSETASISSDEEQVVHSDAVMVQAAKLDLNDKIATHLYFL